MDPTRGNINGATSFGALSRLGKVLRGPARGAIVHAERQNGISRVGDERQRGSRFVDMFQGKRKPTLLDLGT